MWFYLFNYKNIQMFMIFSKKTGFLFISLVLSQVLSSQVFFRKLTDGPLVNTLTDSRSVNFFDINRDGMEDLLITQGNASGASDLIYLNRGNLVFEEKKDVTNEVNDPSVGATIADMNNDGWPDIFVASWYNKNNVLFRSGPDGLYTTQKMDQPSYSESATWGDYDNDGYLDLYVSNSGNQSSENKNFLYKNNNGQLILLSDHNTVFETNYSRGASWIDYDNDGDTDLFICNENQTKNELYRNDKNGNFTRITSAGDLLREASGSMSAGWADVNNDGNMDVFICNSGYFTGQPNRLFINNGNGTFTHKPGIFDTDLGCSFSSSFADFDNDGDVDLLVTNGFCNGPISNFLYKNDGGGNFLKDETSIPDQTTPCSFGAAWGDLNQDGFLDLVIANCKNSNQASAVTNTVWVNEGNDHHWCKVRLKGTTSNASGIGARVYLSAVINGKRTTQMRENSSLSGYCSQNSNIIHFGLKDATTIDTLKVIWPSGIVKTYLHLPVNDEYTIEESATATRQENLTNLKLRISPNPSSSTIKLSVDFTTVPDTVRLTITEVSGKIVYSENIIRPLKNWTKILNAEDLNLYPAMYYVQLSTPFWQLTESLSIIP